MKKFEFDKKHFTYAVYALAVICIAITYEKIIGNVSPIFQIISDAFSTVSNVVSPFLIGFFIAFLLNSLLKFIENEIFGHFNLFTNNKKLKRGISAFLTVAIMVSVLAWVLAYFIPEFIKNIQPVFELISVSIPKYIKVLDQPLDDFLESTEPVQQVLNEFNNLFNTEYKIEDVFNYVAAIPNIFNKMIGYTLNLFLGIMVAFYALCDKETIVEGSKKIIYVFFKRPVSDKILFFAKETNIVFEKYIVGKALDSMIIGIIFFIGGVFLKLPFLTVITFMIFITNMIPYFGPFLGAIPAVILVLLNNLIKGTSINQALWLAIFITILQQIDGIIIGPKILGDSTGLKPLEVIFSIIVGGAAFGILGMFLGVPVFALFKSLFAGYINRIYLQKKL